MSENRPKLAAYAHDAWSGWMRYMFEKSNRHSDGSVTIPKELVARWQRQMSTSFCDLPTSEQQSDLDEADQILDIINDHR